MKKSIFIIISLISFSHCFTQKAVISVPDSIRIDYVDLYTTTPMDISTTTFHKYFGETIKTIVVSDKIIIKKIFNDLNNLFNYSEKVKKLPDTRLIITLYHKKEEQLITMGTTLLNFNNNNYIVNDTIRTCFGNLTGNKW